MRVLAYMLLLTLAACLSVPEIVYSASYNSYSYSAFPNDTCKQIDITKNYIFRLGTNNVISVADKISLDNRANMLNYTYTTNGGAVTTPQLVQNFNVDQNQSFLTLAMTSSTRILNLMSFTLKASTMTSPFYKVFFNNLVFTGLKKNPAGLAQIYNIKYVTQAAFAATTTMAFSIPGAVLPKVENCQCSQSPNNSYLVYWDQYSNVHVYNYTNTSVPPKLIGSLPSNITATDLTQAISFSPDGEYFLLEADAALPVTIVSLSPSSPLSKRTFAFNGTISRALFLDSASSFVVLFNDTAYSIASVALLTVLDSAALAVETEVIEVDHDAGKVYLCKDSKVQVYSTSYASDNCSSNCAVCSTATLCLACSPNYALINNTCELSVSNATATNSSQSNDFTNTSSNNINSLIQQSQNQEKRREVNTPITLRWVWLSGLLCSHCHFR